MTDQKKTHDEQPKLPDKTKAVFVDPSLSDEEVADALIKFFDEVEPLPSEGDPKPE